MKDDDTASSRVVAAAGCQYGLTESRLLVEKYAVKDVAAKVRKSVCKALNQNATNAIAMSDSCVKSSL